MYGAWSKTLYPNSRVMNVEGFTKKFVVAGAEALPKRKRINGSRKEVFLLDINHIRLTHNLLYPTGEFTNWDCFNDFPKFVEDYKWHDLV